jgi:hypothetical protein
VRIGVICFCDVGKNVLTAEEVVKRVTSTFQRG